MYQIKMKEYSNVKYREQWMQMKHVQNVYTWPLLVIYKSYLTWQNLIDFIHCVISSTDRWANIDTAEYAIKTRTTSEHYLLLGAVEAGSDIKFV